MRLFFWTLAHCLTLGLLGLATEVVARNNVPLSNWDLFAIPVLIGFIQTLFLVHRLRSLTLAPATCNAAFQDGNRFESNSLHRQREPTQSP